MPEGAARDVPLPSLDRHVTEVSSVRFMMAVGVVSECQRVPLLTLPGFRSLSVLSIFAIFSAYQLHAIFLICCTGGLVGAVQLVAILYTRKLVWERGDNEKLSVLCSADSEDDPEKGDLSSQTKHDKDYVQHDFFRFGADSCSYGLLTQKSLTPSLQRYIAILKTLEVNLKNSPDHEVEKDHPGFAQRRMNALLEKLKDPDACENSKRTMYKLSGEENSSTVGKQPVEHVDVSCIALKKNVTWGGTFEMSAHSSCAESGGQCTSCEPSDGSGTHNSKGEQSCNGSKNQSCGGKHANQGNQKNKKQSSCGASSRDDDDGDGDDQQKKKPVEIPHGCQTSNSVDVTTPEEEKPADTNEEVAALVDRDQDTDANENCMSRLEYPCQEDVNQEVMAKESPGEITDESVGQHCTADQNDAAAESGVQNSDDTELESWNQILIATFQCQRNFGSKVGHCTEAACCKVQDLALHCAYCPLHVLGGCLDCVKYCELLLYHVAQCHVSRCAHQCHFIKEHIQVHGTPDVEQWTLALDKVFFRPVPPDYPTTQHTEPLNRGRSGAEWSRILVRGPVTAANTLSTGQGVQDCSYEPQQRPRKERVVHWTLNKEKLSVTEDGYYDENHEWLQQAYIGGGGNGRCYQCSDIKTGFLFAIKKIRLPKFEVQELQMWGSLSGQHPNIVELFGAIEMEECVIIFMEFMKGGSVGERLEDHTLNEHQAFDILRQTLLAVQFMHSKMILHRDIKGANVLLDDGKVKLADFGAAIKLTNREFQQDRQPCGTEAFMAPEVCRSEEHTFSADVWSIMCLLYQLLTGQPPWQQHAHGSLLYKIGTAVEPPALPPQCSAAAVDFFQKGFIIQATQRETVTALLRHQVFEPVALDDIIRARDGVTSSDFTDEDRHESSAVNTRSSSLFSDYLVSSLAGNEVEPDEERIFDAFIDHVGEDPLSVAESSVRVCAEQLPPDEQLSSLQSDLLLSLSQQNDDTNLFSPVPDPTETVEEVDLTEFLAQLISCEPGVIQCTSPPAPGNNSAPSVSGAYSMRDLTKVHILKPNGEYLFMVRHNPSVTYGALAEELHGSVAHLTGLDFFTLTLPDGPLLHVWAAIGSEEQRLKIEPAYDMDSWRGWRVDQHGLVEQRPCG